MSDNENFDDRDDAGQPGQGGAGDQDGAGSPEAQDSQKGQDAQDGTKSQDGQAGDAQADRQAFDEIVDGVELNTPEEAAADADQPDPPNREEQLATLLAERTEDLQRLQAEYVNYKRRVDRDRDLARRAGVRKVVTDLMPVLDSIEIARQHGELAEGSGFKAVADSLEKFAAAHDLTSFGEVGEEFDPHIHEALMQVPLAGATVTSVSQVMQSGYRLGDQVLRPARVAVSDPDPNAVAGGDSGDQ